MRRIIVPCLIAGLAASASLLFAANWAKLPGRQIELILATEGLAVAAAWSMLGLLSLVSSRRVGQKLSAFPAIGVIVVGLVLGPFAGAGLAAFAVVSLNGGVPDADRVWDAMTGVAKMFGYAGFAGGASFWLASSRRRLGVG